MKRVIFIVALTACANESQPDPHEKEGCSASWEANGYPNLTTCEMACVEYRPLAPADAPLVCRVRWKNDSGQEERADCREGETFEYGGQLGCCEPGPWGVRFVSCSEESI